MVVVRQRVVGVEWVGMSQPAKFEAASPCLLGRKGARKVQFGGMIRVGTSWVVWSIVTA
jgi:hypothetical protein